VSELGSEVSRARPEGPLDRGPVLQRFEADRRDLKIFAWVRGLSGLGALAGSVAMLLGRLSIPLFMVALLGMVMSVVWMRQARKLWRASGTAKPAALVVHRAGVALVSGTPDVSDTFLPFERVTRFEVDEDRVDVRVTMRDGETVRIEPQYQGVDIYALVRTLDDALTATRSTGRHGQADE
jgi:uncharacterized iron-regulated membrane protein